jgi:hypothetical protein
VENVVALLMWMATDQEMSIPMDDINKMALDVVGKWDERNPARVFTWGALVTIDSQALARLSKLIDSLMTREGSSKDPTATLAFVRRCVAAREEVLTNKDTAAGHVSKKGFQERQKRGSAAEPVSKKDNATERVSKRVELDEDSVAPFGRDPLARDLLPHQKKTPDIASDSTFQRSFADNILRKNLGGKQVAIHIWQHGLPSITHTPLRKQVDARVLQSSMDECLRWFAVLATSIVAYESQPGLDIQHSLGSGVPDEQQQKRREASQRAVEALRSGKAFVEQRDHKKIKYDDTHHAKQSAIENYETGKAQRMKDGHAIKPLKKFRFTLRVRRRSGNAPIGRRTHARRQLLTSSAWLQTTHSYRCAATEQARPCLVRRQRSVMQQSARILSTRVC